MFDIGFAELLLLAVISLLVLGPERLPGAVRTASMWLGRIRRSFNEIRTELEREINTAEFKQDLHNDAIVKQLGETGKDINQDLERVRESLKDLQFDVDKPVGDKNTEHEPPHRNPPTHPNE